MTDNRFDLSLFQHTIPVQVRNYEVDWQGIVHNAVYLLYFEIGRVDYFKHIGPPWNWGMCGERTRWFSFGMKSTTSFR